jgi:sugar-specific transcriptional regulator TrmB
MSRPSKDASEEAVETLTELGLGLYAARTFVALVALSGGTAVEVSQAAEVPRTRVYDAAEELAEWDLIEVDESTPQRFIPVPSDVAAERFLREYRERVRGLRTSLASLEDDRSRAR